jgi:oligopeptide/dipeptide ABC transporter ATP-binding protein
MPPLIEFRNVSKIFSRGLLEKRRTVALENFSMKIEDEPPLITAVVGESGSGKTTLARLLLGLETPTTGEVLYRGRNLATMDKAARRQFLHDVQFVFQDPYGVYNPFYKVDHVLTKPIAKFKLANSRQEARQLIRTALETVGLHPEETLGRYPHQMSGGQRQRVMVARALLLKPRLIVADEPVSMVDASLRATILGNLQKLNQEFGISILYITHDLATGFQISHNMIVLYHGVVAEAGAVEHVVQAPQHPYTQLLMNSIPRAVPERTWRRDEPTTNLTKPAATHIGCKFADRCPHVMPQCTESPPPLYRTDPKRAVACFLYPDAPVLQSDGLERVFVGQEETRPEPGA